MFGKAIFSNLVSAGGTVTVDDADVLLLDSTSGYANAAAVASALLADPITFANAQSGTYNHYIVAYQDLDGDVRIDSPAETIDLTTVDFATATLGYVGNSLSGTLTVTDGTNTARLAMLGSYVAANFHLADDHHGGTLVFDPPVDSSGHLAPPH